MVQALHSKPSESIRVYVYAWTALTKSLLSVQMVVLISDTVTMAVTLTVTMAVTLSVTMAVTLTVTVVQPSLLSPRIQIY
jgi:hypothetical protein